MVSHTTTCVEYASKMTCPVAGCVMTMAAAALTVLDVIVYHMWGCYVRGHT
jgi:hypothetical protein